MANNFVKRLSIVAFAALGLCACDEIVAKPSKYDDPLVTIDNNDDTYHNIQSLVYDAMRESGLASDVLDEVLFTYAESMFGAYNSVLAEENEITLFDAVDSIKNGDKSKANTFIKAHKAYWYTNSEGKRIDDDRKEVGDDADACNQEFDKVVAKWDTIEDRISENLYASLSASSFTHRNKYSEYEFARSLYYDFRKVQNPDAVAKSSYYNGLIYNEILNTQVFKSITVRGEARRLLNRDYYQSIYLNDNYVPVKGTTGFTYVEDEIIPTIYRQLLVEQYILEQNYVNLGRSYARKVNILKIPANDNYPKAAPYLMDWFVQSKINAQGEEITLDTFKGIADLWKGVGLSASQQGILDQLVGNPFGKTTTTDGETYYKATKYGEMLEEYQKITDDPNTSDSAIEGDYTDSYAHTKEIGKQMKEDKIILESYTTDGWFTKSEGVASLPSDISNRLFNITVANSVDNKDSSKQLDANGLDSYDRWYQGTYDASRDQDTFVARINGKNYLKVKSSEKGSDPRNDILFFDSTANAYYVVQIEEAVTTSKLSKDNANSYINIRSGAVLEDIVNDINKIIAKSVTYQMLSASHWLKQMSLEYHDQVVYDYFKDNYPELFED